MVLPIQKSMNEASSYSLDLQGRGSDAGPYLRPPVKPCAFCLQEDFEFDGQAQFQEGRSPSESTTPMEGENMGGWWPEQSAPDTGVRAPTVSISMHPPSPRRPTWLLGCGVFVT